MLKPFFDFCGATQMQSAPNAFAGAAFHCYAGSVSQQANFVNAYPNKVKDNKCFIYEASDNRRRRSISPNVPAPLDRIGGVISR
jgi:hypothetical protein